MAHGVLLSSLQNGGSLFAGDKEFTNFAVTVTGTDDDDVDLGMIDVVSYTSPGGDHGIVFEGTTASPMLEASPGLFIDVLIYFDVVVHNPQLFIDGLGLEFVASAPNDGHAQVVESARVGQPPVDVGQTFVSANPDIPTAQIDLVGQHQHVQIVKDIAVIAGSTQSAWIDQITQTFSQIPEPSTLGLLGVGSLLLVRSRRAMRRAGGLFVTGVAGLLVGMNADPARAGFVTSMPLSALVDSQSPLPGGDKEFDNFQYTIDQNNGKTVFDPTTIYVTTRTEGQDVVLSFEGLFAALSTIQANSALTVTIDFDVNVLDYPNQALHDLGLFFNGQPIDPLAASARVVETVTSGGQAVETLTVQNPGGSLTAHVDLPATYQSVHVSKEITVDGGLGSISTISLIEQRFSQIPEPVTLIGLLLGIPLLALKRRRL